MATWHVIPVLAGLLAGGAFQAQAAQQTPAKPGVTAVTPVQNAPAPRRRARPPVQDSETAAPAFVAPTTSRGAPTRPSPSDPYSGVNLPSQRGDAAYQGGGVVLEQDSNGVNRRIR